MFKKNKRLSELKEGNQVDDVFVVKVKREFRPYVKGFSFKLILSDSSGQSVEYVYWGDKDEGAVRKIYDQISNDSVVRIVGKVGRYNNSLQIFSNAPDLFTVLGPDEYDVTDFIAPPRRNPDEMFSEMLSFIDSVKNPDLKKLLATIFSDKEISEKIKKHPGGIEIHHNRYGGLLEHNLEVLKYCLLSADFFKLDRDLLITGALLHDIGKLDELDMRVRIKATLQGQLLGHIVIGIAFLSEQMKKISTPSPLREKLLHIVASHHGQLDYGSPKEPMFPEALVVHLADMMSSKLNEMQTFMENVEGNTEDDFAYYKRSGKNILLR